MRLSRLPDPRGSRCPEIVRLTAAPRVPSGLCMIKGLCPKRHAPLQGVLRTEDSMPRNDRKHRPEALWPNGPIFLNRERDLWFIFDRLRGNPRFDKLLED